MLLHPIFVGTPITLQRIHQHPPKITTLHHFKSQQKSNIQNSTEQSLKILKKSLENKPSNRLFGEVVGSCGCKAAYDWYLCNCLVIMNPPINLWKFSRINRLVGGSIPTICNFWLSLFSDDMVVAYCWTNAYAVYIPLSRRQRNFGVGVNSSGHKSPIIF